MHPVKQPPPTAGSGQQVAVPAVVTSIKVMNTLSLANVKAHLSAVVDEVEGTHQRVVITRNGRPAAVLISPEDLAALEETLDLLSSPAVMEELADARASLARGEGLTAEQLRAQLAGRVR